MEEDKGTNDNKWVNERMKERMNEWIKRARKVEKISTCEFAEAFFIVE